MNWNRSVLREVSPASARCQWPGDRDLARPLPLSGEGHLTLVQTRIDDMFGELAQQAAREITVPSGWR
jgi:hypothetical protein